MLLKFASRQLFALGVSCALAVTAPLGFTQDHQSPPLAPGQTPPQPKESPQTPEAETPLTSSSAQNAPKESQQYASALLAFWSLSNGKLPPKEVQEQSGLSAQRLELFTKQLPANARLDVKSRRALREDYSPKNRQQRFRARKKLINLVNAFQKSFPEYANALPEMLTAWGETRDITGFLEADSLLLQAKMASVIQVLRNRAQRSLEKKNLSPEALAQQKWLEATKRYQFTAFEPFDPNLGIVALGPSLRGNEISATGLSQHDQFALKVLAEVLMRMEKQDILVPAPLSDNKTRHYLTPRLVPYSKALETKMKASLSQRSRLTVIRIPHKAPKFLAFVPNWSEQRLLVSDPHVKIKEPLSTYAHQEIPPQDFIYFRGVY